MAQQPPPPIADALGDPPTDPAQFPAYFRKIKNLLDAHTLTGASSPPLFAPNGVISIPLFLQAYLTLKAPVKTPAKGQIGAGDAAPIPFPFAGNWSNDNLGGPGRTSYYLKSPDGMVHFLIQAKTTVAGDSSVAGVFPAGYRPAGQIRCPAISIADGTTSTQFQIDDAGNVNPNRSALAGLRWAAFGSFYAEQ